MLAQNRRQIKCVDMKKSNKTRGIVRNNPDESLYDR
jgi:hypothetical protein